MLAADVEAREACGAGRARRLAADAVGPRVAGVLDAPVDVGAIGAGRARRADRKFKYRKTDANPAVVADALPALADARRACLADLDGG